MSDDGRRRVELSLGTAATAIAIITSIIAATLFVSGRPDRAEVNDMIERELRPLQVTQQETREDVRDMKTKLDEYLRLQTSGHMGRVDSRGERR
jgi:dsRNA-specific ribonuclease